MREPTLRRRSPRCTWRLGRMAWISAAGSACRRCCWPRRLSRKAMSPVWIFHLSFWHMHGSGSRIRPSPSGSVQRRRHGAPAVRRRFLRLGMERGLRRLPGRRHLPVLKEIARVVRPVAGWLCWRGLRNRCCPGHALLEAWLNAECSAYLPYLRDRAPETHFLRLPCWFTKAGIEQPTCRTFIGEVQAPLSI